jgi:hypothetical protein
MTRFDKPRFHQNFLIYQPGCKLRIYFMVRDSQDSTECQATIRIPQVPMHVCTPKRLEILNLTKNIEIFLIFLKLS